MNVALTQIAVKYEENPFKQAMNLCKIHNGKWIYQFLQFYKINFKYTVWPTNNFSLATNSLFVPEQNIKFHLVWG